MMIDMCVITQVTRHGGCLGLGLAAMGTAKHGMNLQYIPCLVTYIVIYTNGCI